ncbi:cysteine--tRNA ligase [Solwaraspora sp. WMMD406]|uniref:cysteine--tRNA ligase n=1 Tax=Solwaraspora sp. WMMD406 TaxID=3016095 RepID=UPI0024178F89|nr:cysteine--tRNA ligase [Solwaraspora sp. WMMD406]MDG4763019.1 cysteine--tRNA ligase [Solwaraspora sp. WMMD406]
MIIYNTLTRRKEPFVPMEPGRVRMFVCGPTVYDLSHVGHAKTYTQFDLVARYLRARGYRVTYAQNLTDIDDKIIRRAAELRVSPQQLAKENEQAYLEDMAALHNTSVDVHERALDHIDDIVAQVQALIDRGHAYRLDDGWYFDLSTFAGYGKLSGRTETRPEDSLSRVDENEQKRNPGDFALWKSRKPGEPYWDTRLGPGRPGWHIEDTAITEALFGPQYDLHGGAEDLIFPHHEAEIAQMESASGREPLVRCWMHTGFLRVGGDKMAKSAGNFTTIRDALGRADFRTLRYAFLSQHYRSSMELDEGTLEQARGARRRVENFWRLIDHSHDDHATRDLTERTRDDFYARMDDDFDAPGALAALFEYIREHNRSEHQPGRAAADFLTEVNTIFDAFDFERDEAGADDAVIERLLADRRRLRGEKLYAEADAIRADLTARGIVIEDTATGTRWWRDK